MLNRYLAVGSLSWLLVTGCADVTEDEGREYEEEVQGTTSAVLGTFTALPTLPVVNTAHGFALTASADDNSAHLGFMFTDPTYRQTLINQGAIQNMSGVYGGAQVYVTYELQGGAWSPYEGRTTPQTYAHSELVVAGGASYYTTNYPAFGGLISVIRNGGTGVYALTPAFTTRKAHSIAVPVTSSTLYALMAQSGGTGLTFSTIPISSFGVTYPNTWVNKATLESSAASVASPQMVTAGSKMAGSYVFGAGAKVRATNNPSTVTSAANFPVIGTCADAVFADIAWDGTNLWNACVSSSDVLTLRKTNLSGIPGVTWTSVSHFVSGAIDEIDLEASGGVASLAIRAGTAIKVYKNVALDTSPTMNEVLPGKFDLARTSSGIVLAVCDMTGDRILRTYVSP